MTPPRIMKQAAEMIAAVEAGTVRPKKLANKHGERVDLASWYRLFRRSPKSEWQVLSHEAYNNFSRGTRR